MPRRGVNWLQLDSRNRSERREPVRFLGRGDASRGSALAFIRRGTRRANRYALAASPRTCHKADCAGSRRRLLVARAACSTHVHAWFASLQSRRSSLDSLPSDPTPLNRIRTSSLSGGGMTNLGAVQGDGIAGIDSLDMAVMGRGLSHALGDQPMSMSIDDIGFSERG